MLKKKNRLSLLDFKKIDKSFSSSTFSIRIIENGKEDSRFAFIISKKVIKNAVGRNKSKRVLRSLIERNLEKIKKGFDVSIVLKKEFKKEEIESLENELKELFKKTNLYE